MGLFFTFIQVISFFVGLVGTTIIFIGAILGVYKYILPQYDIQTVRLTIGTHIILGLDFMVGKDIIDTMLLDGILNEKRFWMDLAGLFTVVLIRIVLTHFTSKEIRDLEKNKCTIKA
ncbi:DUF1622 domain-containing protein [Candidatus Gracilibacteria bacterium]|nr:DUF1622 domain-containing protein [Candidatus Gracilibacteria bacterium]